MGYDRGGSFPFDFQNQIELHLIQNGIKFDFELNGIPFGSKLKGKLSS